MREMRDSDLDAFAAISADPEVMRWLGGEVATRAQAWRQMATIAGHWDLRGFGRWVLELRDGGQVVGNAGLWYPEGWPAIEVGWTLGRPHWGSGYATEAARAAIGWARDELGLERIVSLIRPDNESSQAVARRLGMTASAERFEHMGDTLVVWERSTDYDVGGGPGGGGGGGGGPGGAGGGA